MSTRERPADRGARKGRAAQARFATEILEARLNLGKSQRAAAMDAGIDHARWSRIERGVRHTMTWELAGRMAGAVGLDLSVQLYAMDMSLRDAAHVRMLQELRATLGDGWSWRYEARVGSDALEQRAWDASALHRRTNVGFRAEAETRLRDCQALVRRIEGKRQADGEPRVLLVVRDTRANRAAIRAARDILATAFPVPSRSALAALRAGRDPGGDALIILPWARMQGSD